MPESTRPRSVLDDGSAARQRPIVKAIAELTEQFRRVADTLAPLAAALTPADEPGPRLLDCGLCYEENGEEVHPHPECTEVGPTLAEAAIARVRKVLAERRTEVAEFEAEYPPSAWSDAATVTCDRIDDALRELPTPVPCEPGPADA